MPGLVLSEKTQNHLYITPKNSQITRRIVDARLNYISVAPETCWELGYLCNSRRPNSTIELEIIILHMIVSDRFFRSLFCCFSPLPPPPQKKKPFLKASPFLAPKKLDLLLEKNAAFLQGLLGCGEGFGRGSATQETKKVPVKNDAQEVVRYQISVPNMTGRRFHRTMGMIPASPW